jgi:hypothetical protein
VTSHQTNNALLNAKLEIAAKSESDNHRRIYRDTLAVKRLTWIEQLHGSNASRNTWCPWMTSVVHFLGSSIHIVTSSWLRD